MRFGFDHVHLVGSDLDASERFYREMFGAETLVRRDAANIVMRLDGINLLLRSPREGEDVKGKVKEAAGALTGKLIAVLATAQNRRCRTTGDMSHLTVGRRILCRTIPMTQMTFLSTTA